MRALYSLVCRLRLACALAQGMMALACCDWAALTPSQRLLCGCGSGLLLRIVIPSPSPTRRGRIAFLDHLLSLIAAGSLVALATADAVGSWALAGRLILTLKPCI